MAENLKLLRFYFVLLAIFTIGRWALSLAGADYAATHQVFSLVILTNHANMHAGAIHYIREILAASRGTPAEL